MSPTVKTNWKVKPWRSAKYLKWVKSLPCRICAIGPPSDPHHEQLEKQGGMGTKPGDERCIPLCRYHHDQRQHGPMGREIWRKAWGLDPEKVIARLHREWEAKTGKLPGN